MTTNAQAALQAAATVFSGGRGHTAPGDVKGMAASFKNWLDWQDKQPRPDDEMKHWPTGEPMAAGGVEPKAQPLNTLWTVLVRPRNSNATWQLVRVAASSADQATSHLLAQYPGHAWADLTDTGEAPGPRLPATLYPHTPKPGPR